MAQIQQQPKNKKLLSFLPDGQKYAMVAADSVFDFLSEVGVDINYGRARAARSRG